MPKELEKEYLEDLDHYDEGMGIHSTSYEKCKERLIRLAKIDNAKPSEALECLEKVKNYEVENHIKDGWNIILHEEMQEELDTIDQALLKAQEQEKVLKIVFKKQVDINEIKILLFNLTDCDDAERCKRYNACRKVGYKLKQEEFDLLKRYCNGL